MDDRNDGLYLIDHVDDSRSSLERSASQSQCGGSKFTNIKVTNQLRLNVYDILKHEKLVMTVGAVTALEARLEPYLQY